MPLTRPWVIVGLMGSGKTTVGARLAERSGRTFIDNDAVLRARTGRSARGLQRERGAGALHAAEREAFRQALTTAAPAVITAAASVIDDDATRRLMAATACVVWLDVPPAELAGRVAATAHRPLGADPRAALEAQHAARAAHFSSVADVVVDGRRPPGDIVDDLLSALPECESVRSTEHEDGGPRHYV